MVEIHTQMVNCLLIDIAQFWPIMIRYHLTHWGENKMAAILKMTSSTAFSFKKMILYWTDNCVEACYWGLDVNYKKSVLVQVMAWPNKQQAITLANYAEFTN